MNGLQELYIQEFDEGLSSFRAERVLDFVHWDRSYTTSQSKTPIASCLVNWKTSTAKVHEHKSL